MAKIIMSIDPGSSESGTGFLRPNGTINQFRQLPNDDLRSFLWNLCDEQCEKFHVVIEGIQSYGMGVGKEVFDTASFIGRLQEICEAQQIKSTIVYRKDVKLHHCHSPKATDSNIRYAIMDKFGGEKAAVGNKANPGPLYGIKGHLWSALAIALYAKDTNL